MDMFIEERHQAILQAIAQNGRISIGEIRQIYGVSADSARRDLRILEEKGLLKRTHGGAIPAAKVDQRPPRCRDCTDMPVLDNYDAIAQRAAALVREGEVVYLTSGSLGFLMLRHLPRDVPYTLVVNSAAMADALKYWDNVTVYVVGGRMRMHGTASMVDSLATAFVRNLQFDRCFMTGAGVDAAFGLSNGTDETATFQRAVLEHSRQSVLLLPGSKVGVKAFVKVCDVARFDLLITDWDALEEQLAAIEEKGVETVVAERPPETTRQGETKE